MKKVAPLLIKLLLIETLIFVIFGLLFANTISRNDSVYFSNLSEGLSPFGEISREKSVCQKIDLDTGLNNISGISIMFATYNRNNTNMNHLLVSNENNELIKEYYFDSTLMLDNTYKYFQLPEIDTSDHKSINLMITSDNASPGNAITVWVKNGVVSANELSECNLESGLVNTIDGSVMYALHGSSTDSLFYPIDLFVEHNSLISNQFSFSLIVLMLLFSGFVVYGLSITTDEINK